jgi:hypothetical protein
MKIAFAAAIFAMTASLCAAQANPASYRERDAKYLRVAYERQVPIALQTAIVRFAGSGEQTFVVDLVAAVHYADRGYFERLNRRFRDYDAVLYELVAPEGLTRPTPVRDRNSYWQLITNCDGVHFTTRDY